MDDSRSASFDVGVLPTYDGSCRYIEEGTYVIATVTGPLHEEKAASQDPEKGAVEVRCQLAERSKVDRVVLERRIEEYAQALFRHSVDLTKFPRQMVNVAILIVFDDGAAKRIAMNAAVLALLDAGIPLAAVPITVQEGGLITFDAKAKNILAFESDDILNLDDLDTCFQSAQVQASRLLDFFRDASDSLHTVIVPLSDDWRQGPVALPSR